MHNIILKQIHGKFSISISTCDTKTLLCFKDKYLKFIFLEYNNIKYYIINFLNGFFYRFFSLSVFLFPKTDYMTELPIISPIFKAKKKNTI